jgi:hypothetical protein
MSEKHFNALPAGYQLQEYTIKSVLGHGGFGITYLAADNNLGKDVAIKEYLPTEFAVRREDSKVQPRSSSDNDDYEWGLDRFMKEAQTLGLFRHPNIVPVYRAFKSNGTAYMVMEYQRGQSLTELFRKHRNEFGEEDLLNLVQPLLDGLGVVHRAGYLHRDIKPGNIFIREDGSPVLLDFGAARNAVGRKSKNLTSIVTPGYAPLEQYFADGNQGPWTDIYALASILYQAVAGRIPPEAPARVKRDPIVPAIEAGRNRFSETFLSAIDAALAVEEEQRPQNVEQWRAMLLGQELPDAAPAATPDAASMRGGATILAGYGQGGAAAGSPSASMRFPTRAHGGTVGERKGSGGAGKVAALVVGLIVLLGASAVGAYIALNPDHGLFGPSTAGNEKSDTTKISSDMSREEEVRRKADEDKAKRDAEEWAAKRKADEDKAKRDAEERAAKRKADEEKAKREAEAEKAKREEQARRDAEAEKAKREEQARRDAEAEKAKREEQARRDAEAEKAKREEQAKRDEPEDDPRRRPTPGAVSCDYSVIKGAYSDETDCFFVQKVFALALTTARDSARPSSWVNPRTGTSGTFTILETVQGSDGAMCRRFQQSVTAQRRTRYGTGTACFRNGAWQISS